MAIMQARKRVNQVICFTALAMLVLGLLMTIAPFIIQDRNKATNFYIRNYYGAGYDESCKLHISKFYEQFWSGFTTIVTSALVVVSYPANLREIVPRINIPHQKAYCLVAIPITLMSALAVMFFEQEPFGNVRSFNEDFRCYESSNKSYQVENQIHRKQMLSWFYVLLISSNILVVACFVQLMAFFTIWVLNVLEGTDESHYEQLQQQQEWNITDDLGLQNDGMTPLLTSMETNEPHLFPENNPSPQQCAREAMEGAPTAELPELPPPYVQIIQIQNDVDDQNAGTDTN